MCKPHRAPEGAGGKGAGSKAPTLSLRAPGRHHGVEMQGVGGRNTQALTGDQPSGLLERFRHLSELGESLAAVLRTSKGRLVFVGGEAGVGKTALLRLFCDQHHTTARALWGACDPLFTPRPLGPFLDIAQITGGELEEVVQSDARPHDVAAALMRDLRAQSPTILVLEDVHWADEATLDVLRLLGRRVETVPALVFASYRDDELDLAHPLRIVLGELATGGAIGRLKIASLSPEAVATLAQPHGVDAHELYRKTAGNPFFVTEVLAAGEEEIPVTVRDAVMARAARLSIPARSLLEAAAVVPLLVELWLLEALAGETSANLDECLASGILEPHPGSVAFRHELARLAVEELLAPNKRVVLHRAALAALAAPPSGAPDLARLAHHAEAAGDIEAVLRFAPAAAERAASLGAHREAAAQFARALRFADDALPETVGELFDRRSHECYLGGGFGEAIEARERALECHRKLGDRRREGDSLRALSRLLRYVGRTEDGMRAGREATALLESLPPGRELAMAYANVSHLYMSVEDADQTKAWGTRALQLAKRLDDVESLVYALINIGTVELLAQAPEGTEKLERSLDLAQRAGLEEHAGRAFCALVWWAPRHRLYAVADGYLEAGLEYCNERGLDLWRHYLVAYHARAELDRGEWADAVDSAMQVHRDPRTSPVPRIVALAVLGLVRARRGDPDQWQPLDEAWALAEPTGELQRIEPAAAARAEAAWLEGRNDAVGEATEAALELALRCHAPWVIGEMAYWRWRAGIQVEIPPGAAEPYALQIAGDWRRAAELWIQIGSPYEAALALADADDLDTARHALDELHRLGARPAASIVARRLRTTGARRLPRGPRPATQDNPANLTPRELEVLALLAQGARNADIAEQLVLSEKTVDHHVSAILRKLGVHTRGQACAEAARLGLAGQDR